MLWVENPIASGDCMLWLVFQVGEKASQLSLSFEVRAGDGARAGPTCIWEGSGWSGRFLHDHGY
jgi:hypothetical protein